MNNTQCKIIMSSYFKYQKKLFNKIYVHMFHVTHDKNKSKAFLESKIYLQCKFCTQYI